MEVGAEAMAVPDVAVSAEPAEGIAGTVELLEP
jgi:hypothetical protein